MKNTLLLLFTAILLAGCGSTGKANLAKLNQPIPSNEARIIVERDASLLYLAAAVDVRVNGSKIASLGRGGSVIYDISKGNNVLSVSTLGSFGQYTINFNAKPKKTYQFIISPRGEALAVGSAFGLIGDAVNANVSEQSGYFQIGAKGEKP